MRRNIKFLVAVENTLIAMAIDDSWWAFDRLRFQDGWKPIPIPDLPQGEIKNEVESKGPKAKSHLDGKPV